MCEWLLDANDSYMSVIDSFSCFQVPDGSGFQTQAKTVDTTCPSSIYASRRRYTRTTSARRLQVAPASICSLTPKLKPPDETHGYAKSDQEK